MIRTFCQAAHERLRKPEPYLQSVLATNVGVLLATCAVGLTYDSELITLSVVFSCLGFGLFLVHAPVFVRAAFLPAVPAGLLWLAGVTIFALIGLWCPDSALLLWASVISVGGYCLAATHLLLYWNDSTRKISLLTVVMITLLLAALFLGEAWGVYRNPLVIHALAVADTPHHLDPWFQSVLVAAIQNYGIPSAGYDGVSYLPYHHAVHFVLAAVAQFTGVPPIIAVSVGFPLLLMPSFIWMWGGMASALGGFRTWRNPSESGEAVCIFWIITFIGLGQWFPMPIRQMFFLWNNVFQSDSHAFSLIVSMALISSAIEYYASPSRKPFEVRSTLSIFLLAAVASFVLTWTKVTFVHITLGIAALSCLRLRGRVRVYTMTAMAGIVAGVIVATPLFFTSLSDSALHLEFLGFWKAYLEPGSWLLYPVAAMFWGFVFCALYFRSSSLTSFKDLTSGMRQRSLLPAEVVLGISILGIVPGLLLGGALSFNVMYYEETSRLTAILATAALATTMPMPVKSLKSGHGSIAQVFALMILTFALFLAISNVAAAVVSVAKTNALYRGSKFASPPGIDSEASKPRISKVVRSGRLIDASLLLVENLKNTEKVNFSSGSMLGELLKLQKLPRSEKHKTLLFLARSSAVWKIAAAPDKLNPYVAMLPIGITGLALLDGTQTAPSAELAFHYAIGRYAPPQFTEEAGYDNSRLLDRANALGYSQVLILNEDKEGRFATETISAASPDVNVPPNSD